MKFISRVLIGFVLVFSSPFYMWFMFVNFNSLMYAWIDHIEGTPIKEQEIHPTIYIMRLTFGAILFIMLILFGQRMGYL